MTVLLPVTTVLNLDVLGHISHFCKLRDRYYWSVCHRHFQITPDEWARFVQQYVLNSVDDLRKICLRQYCSNIQISRRPQCLWSEQLDEPLTVWSPWTLRKLCTISGSGRAFFRFREHRFVSFVQDVIDSFRLKSSTIRRLNHTNCVYAMIRSVSNANVPVFVQYRQKTMQRRCLLPIFQALRWKSLRCLLEFRVVDQQLWLRTKRLEFSIL